MHQGLEDVPALLSGGGDDGTHSGEVVGTPLGAEKPFGLIVRKRRARVGEESQASLLVLAEAEREVMTDAAFLSSALAGPERLSLPFIPSCLPTTARLCGTDIILSQWIL